MCTECKTNRHACCAHTVHTYCAHAVHCAQGWATLRGESQKKHPLYKSTYKQTKKAHKRLNKFKNPIKLSSDTSKVIRLLLYQLVYTKKINIVFLSITEIIHRITQDPVHSAQRVHNTINRR